MNFVGLFLFLLGLLLTVVIGNFLFPYTGWWVTLPAPILGYGLIVILLVGLNRLSLRRQRYGGALCSSFCAKCANFECLNLGGQSILQSAAFGTRGRNPRAICNYRANA